jgi:hypothetical protein
MYPWARGTALAALKTAHWAPSPRGGMSHNRRHIRILRSGSPTAARYRLRRYVYIIYFALFGLILALVSTHGRRPRISVRRVSRKDGAYHDVEVGGLAIQLHFFGFFFGLIRLAPGKFYQLRLRVAPSESLRLADLKCGRLLADIYISALNLIVKSRSQGNPWHFRRGSSVLLQLNWARFLRPTFTRILPLLRLHIVPMPLFSDSETLRQLLPPSVRLHNFYLHSLC